MEDHLATSLAEADALFAEVDGRDPPSPPLSPLLGAVPFWSDPEHGLPGQAYTCVDPESLDLGSNDRLAYGDEAGLAAASSSAPYTSGTPGASLWNPDVDRVTIDTLHPQDVPLAVDVLSLSCVLARRTWDIAHHHAEDTHDTFVDKPYRLDEDFSQDVPSPSPGVEARSIFPAQPPRIVAGEVRAVEHMLLTVGHWLATVDVNSVPLEVQQALSALALSAAANAVRRFPDAQPHEPLCPHYRGTDLSSPSS